MNAINALYPFRYSYHEIPQLNDITVYFVYKDTILVFLPQASATMMINCGLSRRKFRIVVLILW